MRSVGDNVVAVRVDNNWNYRERATNQRYHWNDKNFNANYGGIPKNVFLYSSDLLYRDWETDRKSTRLNSSHITRSRMPSSA